MPRPKKPGIEPKRRSRNGCWPCKARKVKCGEEKPKCINCERQGETCDYSIRLNWGGRCRKETSVTGSDASSTASGSPYQAVFSFQDHVPPLFSPTPENSHRPPHARSHSNQFHPRSSNFALDPELLRTSQSRTPTMSQSSNYNYHDTARRLPASAPYTKTQFNTEFDNPLSVPNYSSGAFTSVNAEAPLSPPSMPPPRDVLESRKKHQKQSASMGSPSTTISDAQSPYTGPLDPFSPYIAMPLTPDSSVRSGENLSWSASCHQSPADTPDLRRMSVQSIINNDFSEHSHNHRQGKEYPIMDYAAIIYGYDLGLPDLDTPNNDDFSAITIFSRHVDTMELDEDSPYGNPDPRSQDKAFESGLSGGYYVKPVPIKIAKSLGALPPLLMENPMNLVYFHHFLNHTARILVPHDCERNPFRQILPQMAVADDNIMHLLLAYSAAHRARMLKQPEPSNRIAVWVQDVFPKLRQALNDNPNDISDNTLAAVIMMASLEIICSGTFEVPITWQNHLTMARQMIVARGGPQGMDRENHVAYFLSRWFAYLDVLGSLSGNRTDMPLGSSYWSNPNAAVDEDFEIDCLMGFTTHCIGNLARISELAKVCEPLRIDDKGNVRNDWMPDTDIVGRAVQIRRQLEEGLLDKNIRKGCNHRSSAATESKGAWDAAEIYATNEMYHWAGLIHLYRRVLGKPATDVEVQHAVREIVSLLNKIRRGSTAEACLIFPMFAAGCDTVDQEQRGRIMERLKSVEGFGMTHTPKVATLLQSVWDTGKPWESLVSGEFFG
ncbi:fungal-specific transcription factor domain-containing protein [Ampelomyces quisqualis]|uniref:Fungal-specific transcription factor domain-containing protein n=1 Tax=Ampelomyces quisqualis TaxID=50730 RepID=A0A6A5QWL0_AMPQU|nr:fungal-specific transcription factor domain-containing protein [Ampelomyces quisqualis]